MSAAQIGDTTRDGLAQITDTRWDSNGTLLVTVREMIGGFDNWAGGKPAAIRKMRSLARRALPHLEETRSAAMVRAWYAAGQHHATFAVSRLEQ